jgi:hypothetical protein
MNYDVNYGSRSKKKDDKLYLNGSFEIVETSIILKRHSKAFSRSMLSCL